MARIELDDGDFAVIVGKAVKAVLAELRALPPVEPMPSLRGVCISLSPADKRYGYPFGVDGVISSKTVRTLLGCHRVTVWRLANDGHIRCGDLLGGVKYCRRSVAIYLQSKER